MGRFMTEAAIQVWYRSHKGHEDVPHSSDKMGNLPVVYPSAAACPIAKPAAQPQPPSLALAAFSAG
jgi:hypothetical protein